MILGHLGIRVMTLSEVGFSEEIEETGATFQENAIAKAAAVAEATGKVVVADDSGLVVHALGGRPGVMSARYGGEGLTDAERNALLLEEMADIPWRRRTAEFVCVIALCRGGELVGTVAGRVCGLITLQPRGESGFGYDPLFLYLPAGRTFAQMSTEQKSAVSHRGRALRQLPRLLENLC